TCPGHSASKTRVNALLTRDRSRLRRLERSRLKAGTRETLPRRALQRPPAGILGLRAELLLDAQELIVFRGAVGARERAGLDLPAIGGDGEIRDGCVLG